MVNFGPLTHETVGECGAPQQISTGFATSLCYCSDVAHWRPTKPCTMFGRLMGWYTLYTSLGVLVPDGVLSGAMVQYTLCVQVLRSFILAALLHGNRAAGVSQNLRHATRNETSGYATMVHGRGCNPHRCTTTFANVEITSL